MARIADPDVRRMVDFKEPYLMDEVLTLETPKKSFNSSLKSKTPRVPQTAFRERLTKTYLAER